MLNRLKIGNKIGAGFAVGLAILATIGAISHNGTNQLVTTARQEAHTYQVLAELQEVLSLIKDAETGQRGFLLTGEQRYLEPYNAAIASINQKVRDLRRLTADNPNQQRNLDALEPQIMAKLDELQETVRLKQAQRSEAALNVVRTDRGKQAMDEIRRTLDLMKAKEQELLRLRAGAAKAAASNTLGSITYGVPLTFLILALIGYLLTRTISRPLKEVSEATERIAGGDLLTKLPESDRQDEVGILTRSFNQMMVKLRETTQRNDEQTWLKTNLAEVSQQLQGQRDLAAVSRLILSNLAPFVGAQQGVFYVMNFVEDQPVLKMLNSYAYQERRHLSNEFRLGEGLVGQCALEKQRILLTDVPDDYIRIHSGLGSALPLNILVLPILFENQVTGVLELASFQRFSDLHLTLLDEIAEAIGVALNTIAADMRTQQLLEESQTLAEELQVQQEELEESNQRLQEQTKALEESEFLLKEQQEELKQTNEELQQLNQELEEKAELLTIQKREVEQKNQEIDRSRTELEEKAAQLALSSKYKSEFLANMSHELRTPLNSLLILARLLADNNDGNLTGKQVEYSRTIYSSGNDLLELINDILDLAKIESGTISLEVEALSLGELQLYLERTFEQVAQSKELSFTIALSPDLPASINTDIKRLQQILKNLLSNAFKFTERGGVTLSVATQNALATPGNEPTIAFAVSDTGIGILPEKQKVIFEAFQQADGTTSRKYGGTGLGLSISRELAHLLGGSIQLVSQPGQGSTFTLYLPQTAKGTEKTALPLNSLQPLQPIELPTPAAAPPLPLAEIADDRDRIQSSDRVLLIIEDDINFARILLEMARQQGFKSIVALRSHPGLALAQHFKPDAIMLDIHLPDMDGWTVLDRLKHNPETRHIPIHILSSDDQQQRGLHLGAVAYLQKPVSPETLNQIFTNIKGFIDRPVKSLLIIEDDVVQANSIAELIGNGDVQSSIVGTGAEALSRLRSHSYDCVVMDLGLPDMSGFDLIEQIKQEAHLYSLPIIIYTGKELTRPEETRLKRLAETIIVKDVRSPERLLDETALFLHRVQANLPQPTREILEELRQSDPVLAHKKVLIIDDDVRNIFALTSLLEQYEMEVVYAENGRDGIEVLQANPDTDAVLMDVMMPEMDGYETTRAIRQQEKYRTLPIVALTAKAMQGDRERCIEVGASDYITKPVDPEQLLSLLRVWLYR
jgi:CheY-like chemotaxis protein/signal transduction histidine kinase